MKHTQTLSVLSLLAINSSLALAQPDLICSTIDSAASFGTVDGIVAYSFGATLCNIGDALIEWDANTDAHPLISQTLYRLSDGQFHQIGIGFVRHGILPLSSNACGLDCQPTGFDSLGPGCSTTNSSVINGFQANMGPRSEVNPFEGTFPFPFTSINQTGDAIYKRLQVSLADVSDPAALYFVETQVITASETTPETRANNASYRQVIFSPGSASASLVGPTYTEQAAIYAWRDHGLGIGMPDPDVLISEVTIPNDGIIHVGSKATDLGNNSWRYDYALHNQNTTQSIHSLKVPIGFTTPTNTGMHDIAYVDAPDSFIENTDWDFHNDCTIRWATDSANDNLSANAIRWGTTYSFSFSLNEPPTELNLVRIGLFDPQSVDSVDVAAHGPQGLLPCSIADLNCDTFNNFFDVSAFLNAFVAQDPSVDFAEPFGTFNFFDVSAFLNAFGAGCP